MDDAMPIDEKVSHLLKVVDDLTEQITSTRKFAADQARAAETRANARTDQLAKRVDAAHSEVRSLKRTMSGGSDGAGLRVAAWGLGITILGTVLGAPALMIG